MKINAAVVRAPRSPLSIERVDLEAPRHDEILVRIVAVGVCRTDMVMRDQHLPTPQPVVLGHEGAGIVEAVGSSVTKVVAGDHVVLTYSACGIRPSCARAASPIARPAPARSSSPTAREAARSNRCS